MRFYHDRSHHTLDYRDALGQIESALFKLEKQLMEDWKKLDDCFMSLVA